MGHRHLKPACLLLGIFCLLMIIAGCATVTPGSSRSQEKSASSQSTERVGPGQINRAELQAALMSFADTFNVTINQAVTIMADQLDTPEARLAASKMQVYATSSAVDIVTGPYPGIALLDMLVFVTLNRIVWEDYYLAKHFGQPAEIVVGALKMLEAQIWSIAAKVMTTEQQEDLKALIVEWRAQHPIYTTVHFIRFSDFKGLGKKPRLESAAKPGGLFSQVSEATRAVDEVRDTAERMRYLLMRMQLIAGFQGTLMYHELSAKPEFQQILTNINDLKSTADSFAATFDKMPDQIGKTADTTIKSFMERFAVERQDTIEQFMKELNAERKEMLEDFLSEEKRLSGVLVELRETMKIGVDLVSHLNNTLAGVDTMATRFKPQPSDVPAEPFDIKDYQAVVDKVAGVTGSLNNTVVSIDRLLSSAGWERTMPRLIEVVEKLESDAHTWMLRSFLMGAGLILIFFIALFAYRHATKKI